VIECTYDQGKFIFMRERVDKKTPNGKRVFERVMQSIQDNFTEEFILDHIDGILKQRAGG
jgi:hypothetical protein